MSWADLPDELLDLIVSRDPNKEFSGLKYRSVCKSWEVIASRHCSLPYPSPCLMYYENDRGRWNLFKNNDTSSAEIPEFKGAKALYSKHGCLLMSRGAYKFFIFNLENKQIFHIPKPDEIYKNISFVNQPGSSDCSIIGVKALPSNAPQVYIGVLKWGKDKWNHYEHECKIQFQMSDCAPILHRGLLYCLDTKGNIGTFDIEKTTKWTTYDECLEPADLRKEIKQIYFAKLEEELFRKARRRGNKKNKQKKKNREKRRRTRETLFAVFLTHKERNVNVYKLLEPDMKWKRVVSLGDKILFVGRGASFGGKALFESMANKIYFPNKQLFYCLDSQQYLPFDDEGNFPLPLHKRCSNHATWIDRPPAKFLELFK